MTFRAPFRTPSLSRFGSGRDAKGVSLLLALIFVVFFGAILITLVRFNAYEIRVSEARVAGWEIVEIAKAARLYVRDRYANDPALRTTASTPSRITLNTLRTAGYLPRSFGRTSAGNDLSSLNQNIYVIMANWSGNSSLGGSSTLVTTVPSAFVYFDASGKTAPDLMINAIETARRLGASINGALFDRDGNNRSADCRGAGPAVSVWDTGCLTNGEFQQLVGAIGLPTVFRGGALIIPAWKSVQPDLRAVLRFPQPENPGFATMLTDLQMGTPLGSNCNVLANQVSITTLDAGGAVMDEPTYLCDVQDDDATHDRRFNIDRIGNIQAQRMITEAQYQDYGGESAQIGTAQDDTMRIEGNVTMNNDLRIYNRRALPSGAPSRFNLPNGTLAVERNTYLYSSYVGGAPSLLAGIATIGTATARNLVSDQLDTPDFRSNQVGIGGAQPQMSVTTKTTLTGNTTVSGDTNAEMITEQMNAPNAVVIAADNTGEVGVSQTLSMRGSTMSVNGIESPSQYAAVIGEVTNSNLVHVVGSAVANPVPPDLRFLSGTGSITANSTRAYSGAPMPTVTTARCLESANLAGGCPERQYFPPNITP